MSHVTTCDSKMDDKQAVISACKDLGLKVEENRVADLGFSNRIQADIVIIFPEKDRTTGKPKELGLVWNKKEKKYEVKMDGYDGTVQKLLGGDLRKLKQQSSLRKLESVARRQGYRVSRNVKVDAKTGAMQTYLYQM